MPAKDQVQRLFTAARDDYEVKLLESLALRAGLRWRCDNAPVFIDLPTGGMRRILHGGCRWINLPRSEKCTNCGNPRVIYESVDALNAAE